MAAPMPTVDLSENRQPDLYAAAAIPYFFALVAVALRFWSRWTMRAGWWLDDWLVLVALIFGTGLMADTFWWTPRAFGKHIQTFGPDVKTYFFIGLFIAELTYTGVIVFVKFSILALYWRIFNRSNIKIPIVIFFTIVASWGLAVFFLIIFQCIPTKGYWDKSINASCNVNSQSFLFGISIPNILTDVALLILPAPYIMKLNMSSSQKRVLCSLFLLGGVVCIASILRLISVLTEGNNPDVTWSFVNQGVWATVETDFAMIGACLPCLRPVWLRVRAKYFDSKQSVSSDPHTWTISTPQRKSKKSRGGDPLWDASLFKSQNADDDCNHSFTMIKEQSDVRLTPYLMKQPETAIAV